MNTEIPNLEKLLRASNNVKETIQRINTIAKTNIKRINRLRFKKGILHEQGIYTGLLDRLYGLSLPKYTLQDIRRGYVEEQIMAAGNLVCLGTEKKPIKAPTNPYWVGRYVAMGNHLLESSKRNGDVATALEAICIFTWLGQAQRSSVKRRVNQVYDIAIETSKEYNVPLTEPTGRKSAVLHSDVNYEVRQYLRYTQPTKR